MILGISGKMRTGKNVIADYLVSQYHFTQTAFADKLKEISMDLFGLTREECFDKKTPRSRDVLQRVGVAMRDVQENIWCEYVLKNISEGQDVVISDVRFPNEVEMIKEYGGKIIRVNRLLEQEFGMDHISETALDKYEFDYSIDNNGTLDELYKRIDTIMGNS